MQTEVEEMHGKIDKLTEDVEDLDEVRTSTNVLIGWAEKMTSLEQFKFP